MRLRRRRVLAAALSLVLLATAAACGDDDAATPSVRISFTYEQPAAGVDTAALATTIRARLQGIGILVEAVDTDVPGEVAVALEDERLAELATDLLTQQGVLRFRPVLGHVEGAAAEIPLTPAAQDLADQPVTLPQDDADGATIGTWQLGPAVVDAGAVESATSAELDTQPAIKLTLVQPALDELNELAALCFTHADTCPAGQVAVTVDGVVVAAPEVAQPSFAVDEIEVAPQLDEVAVRRLATILDSGPLPVALTPAEG